ncbi:cation diffusion facilitator family transporter [uncultured Sulfitobacter sp.]|uniref:cation diffusion facilitator family transporter n=1 Tax=uncultured Sulfitobacter sp. TaxID=191468 RepID=UPI002604467B|nr:cation diffusion facilitator family transporter [uncultured Sulfitobacter sp.]
MSTGHDHHHVDPEAGDARVAVAVGINMLLTVAQIIGGVVSGSLSLIADALHNFSDAVSLIIAFVARKIARRPADARMTFGYGRIEAVAALINYTTLVVIGLYLIYEGVARMFEPSAISGWIVVIVAGIALAVDLGTAALTYTMSKSSMNIRAAFLHNLADAMGSVAVIVAGTLVILYGWTWVDPAVTLLIAGYILYHALTEMPGVMRLLMLGSPPELDTSAVIDAIEDVAGVESVHHVHLWMMQEHSTALEAHVRLSSDADAEQTRRTIKEVLANRFDVHHSTLETEEHGTSCDDHGQRVGHAV